ncbi:MAG: potassium/proton antiporter [Cytophagaceae bacterium]
MFDLETFLLSISLLVIISVLLARWGDNTGLPVLLLFLGVGMLAGSEGWGKIHFDNPVLAQQIGVIALVFILFSGGLDTNWKFVKPVTASAVTLSTFGVLLTAASLGLFINFVSDLPLPISFLLGSVVASTDAAAVFGILGSKSLNLKGKLKPLLELESGSNDPMAIFLTIGILEIIQSPDISWWFLIQIFMFQMVLGLGVGFASGKLIALMINRIKIVIEGLYPVFVLAFAVLIFSFTAKVNGSGFLAVYVAGIVIGNHDIVYKRTIFRFFDGLAWLSQIIMFLTLGLLVFPSHIIPIIPIGVIISIFLIAIARPVSVFLSLAFSSFNVREKLLVSWVGLRGAVPIILATFPMITGVEQADFIFNVVFFIVLTSALLQGWSIPIVARLLRLTQPMERKIQSRIEFSGPDESDMMVLKLVVPDKVEIVNKSLVDIGILKGSLVVLIHRQGSYFVPSGGTILLPGDVLEVLVPKEKVAELKLMFSK